MRKLPIFLYVWIQDVIVELLTHNLYIHRWLFAPGIENYRWVVGRWRAWRTFELAKKRVPAYRDYLEKTAPHAQTYLAGWTPSLDGIPEMDKARYIKPYATSDRCVDGHIPRRGVVADESSGSSGTPTSWVRGHAERLAVRLILQATFSRYTSEKPTFVLNAFSLGAWATGMNVSTSLADVTIIKSTGPDMTKIIETMQSFGPGYSYVIMGYPPFLKNLTDDPRIDLRDYDVIAGFGGEGMSENMRGYLLKSFREVIGSYGASDLEINIAAETEFTIALRQELVKNAQLRRDLTRTDYGVLPMIFQYNSFDYVIETNDHGELLVTICRKQNISPRIRYNIHDRGHVLRMPDLEKVLRRHGLERLLGARGLDLPLLFHYGRSDLSLDFYGANVTPDSVREFVYSRADLARDLATYRMIAYEDAASNKQLQFALLLKTGVPVSRYKEREVEAGLIDYIRRINADFDHAYGDAKPTTRPKVKIYKPGTGPFMEDSKKLKNEYVWQLDKPAAKKFGLID